MISMLDHNYCGTELILPKSVRDIQVRTIMNKSAIVTHCPKCKMEVLLDLRQFDQACQEYFARYKSYPGGKL